MSQPAARVAAEAKLNLGLRVLAREASGYHSIETLFVRIALGDLVSVRATDGQRLLDCRGASLGAAEENLAYRAAVAYADAAGWPAGFAISLVKRVPVGAGLGGGSADAAAVLRALETLAPEPIGEATVLALAARIGADVPFLASGAPLALAWGRGDRLMPLPPLPARWIVLSHPGFGVSTADAYRWIDEAHGAREATAPSPRIYDPARLNSWVHIGRDMGNDFEVVLAERQSEVSATTRALVAAGAVFARLTGSGSTVYGVFESQPDLAALAATVPGALTLTQTVERAASVQVV